MYYSSQTLFLGAEFTRAYAQRSGDTLQPARGAEILRPAAAAKAAKAGGTAKP